MREQLNQELHIQLEGMQDYRSYQNKIDALRKQSESLEKEILILEAARRKEDQDVEKLEKGGLLSFYLKIRGKYESTMDREVLEAAAAKVKLENKQFELEQLKQSLQSLKAEQAKYAGCERKYQQMYEKKLEELMAEDSSSKKRILEIQTQIAESQHNIKELKEAINAGNNVMSQLEVVHESLNSAAGWGTWDVLGGGFMADMMKHSHLDDAKEEVEKLQSLMSAFHTELADVNLAMEIRIDTDGFSKFADFFFDGIFADMNMQSRIRDSIADVEESKKKTDQIMKRMQAMILNENSRIQTHQDKITAIVNEE